MPKHRSRTRGDGNARLPKSAQLERAGRRKVDVARNPVHLHQHSELRFKHWLGILVLAPICLITALSLFEMSWRMLSQRDILSTESFRFFFLGILSWSCSYFLAGLRPVSAYVLGHELSHYVVAKASGAKIYDFHFSAQGGYVDTNKSNTFISLAPYILPIYSIAVLLLFGTLGLFTDLNEPHHVPFLGRDWPLRWSQLMFALLGISWAFHITYTVLTLRTTEQSDLTRNGEFFSLMLIFAINAVLLMAMFIVTSPNSELGLRETLHCWWGTARWVLPGV